MGFLHPLPSLLGCIAQLLPPRASLARRLPRLDLRIRGYTIDRLRDRVGRLERALGIRIGCGVGLVFLRVVQR